MKLCLYLYCWTHATHARPSWPSVDADKSIAKRKEQEKPKGFTVWVGGFPDNCVDDHKLFHREMERVGALARRTLQTPRALPDTAAPLSPRRRGRGGVQAVRAAVRMGALRGAGPEDPGKVLSVTVRVKPAQFWARWVYRTFDWAVTSTAESHAQPTQWK